jgi:HlyD family secretion protein
MKRFLRWFAILGVLSLLIGLGAAGVGAWWKERTRVRYRQAEATRGRIVAVVNSTGTVKPVRSVQVGTFVSGPIIKLYVDFNDRVKKGQLLAVIDPKLYEPNLHRDQATYSTRRAEIEQIVAKLRQAIRDEKRAIALRAQDKGFISDTDMDQFKFARMSLHAQLKIGGAAMLQALENVQTSQTNLDYTKIMSPVDGVIIDRKIDEGQTVAASFQTPDLFIVAPDLKDIQIHASVDETDIGLIQDAEEKKLPVRFTVDAYPDDLFEGRVFQIRMNSTTVQNVVTYPVVVNAANPLISDTSNDHRKLRPGMTVNLSFQVGERANALRVPNAALRFVPQREQVRPADRKVLEGSLQATEIDDQASIKRSAEDKAELRRQRNRRHVWVQDGEFLRAVEVITGLSDSKHTEVVSGDLSEGMKLITGIDTRARPSDSAMQDDE